MVTDLRHFLDLSESAPGPARKLAAGLYDIVRAATAATCSASWMTALPCGRRPKRKPCAGRIIVWRNDAEGQIPWRCSSCGDDGVITDWEGSPVDLRLRRPRAVDTDRMTVLVSTDVAAALRTLLFLNPDSERLVYAAKSSGADVALTGCVGDLEELVNSVAAEANHEDDRRRQKRLDDAFDALSHAI